MRQQREEPHHRGGRQTIRQPLVAQRRDVGGATGGQRSFGEVLATEDTESRHFVGRAALAPTWGICQTLETFRLARGKTAFPLAQGSSHCGLLSRPLLCSFI